MQDPFSSPHYQAMMKQPVFPEQERLNCPRCDSTNTKFCYYNNYSLSQPRHFCKSCRRYWTKGGALRNIPIGGASRRKNTKRAAHNPIRKNPDPDSTRITAHEYESRPKPGTDPAQHPTRVYGLGLDDQDMKVLDISGGFSSLLASNMNPGGNLETGSGLTSMQTGDSGQNFGSGWGPDS